ncbi:unnamed protein product [Parascedosporium putredinis]|uniref:NAD(P)-binding domain-containing protein n=1 Tax=Parascedosporium putredinis TaxID=1442378 RepID=A0A9P1M8L0_9PEZI|nr:unnamed protein product [Parascedosporium putredinis]CAI7990134.1 unnamed protein product [Parascedosporium putredinis]
MPRRIVILPASTKAGRETIRVLLQSESKPFVRAVYRNPAKAPAEFLQNPNFEAVQGDVSSGSGLDFAGFDTLFYIPPRPMSPGVLRLNHISDEILKNSVPQVSIVRPGYITEEWAHFLDAAKADPPVLHSWISPVDHKVPMVDLKDIGECCANTLLSEQTKPSPYYFKLFGPQHYSSADLKDAVEKVVGTKTELKLIERDQLSGFFAQLGIPETHVPDFVGMTTAVLPGGIMAGDFGYDEDTVRGKVELVDGLREMYEKKQQG